MGSVSVSENLRLALLSIFNIMNRFYNIPVPGLGISVGSLFVSALVFLFGARIIRVIFGGGDIK